MEGAIGILLCLQQVTFRQTWICEACALQLVSIILSKTRTSTSSPRRIMVQSSAPKESSAARNQKLWPLGMSSTSFWMCTPRTNFANAIQGLTLTHPRWSSWTLKIQILSISPAEVIMKLSGHSSFHQKAFTPESEEATDTLSTSSWTANSHRKATSWTAFSKTATSKRIKLWTSRN